jgi:HlyD family secretion protein
VIEDLMGVVHKSLFSRRLRLGLIGIVAGIPLLAGCGTGQAEEAPRVQLAEVVRRDLEITAEATGQLEPVRKVEVKSRASGQVLEVLVETGDRVEPGTLLVRIDPRDVQNDYQQARVDHQVAQERFAIAESQLRRSESLLRSGVITEQEHESRRLEYVNAQSNLVRAETNLQLARLRTEDVTIRAPLAGIVLERLVEEGTVIQSAAQNVSGGTTLLTIANLDEVQVRTLVDETDVGRIQPGMPVTVRVDAHSERSFQGVVEKIEPMATVQQSVVMFPILVKLDNREGVLKPGMSAEVTVLTAERPGALTLPNNAIVSFNELAPAGSVLGIPESRLEVSPTAFQELARELSQRQRTETGEEPPAADVQMPVPGAGGLAEIRERVARGEISQEEVRALMERTRAQGGGVPGAGRPGAQRTRSGAQSPGQGRPGIVFVEGGDGLLRARPVLIGVSDWSNSEILVGVEEGERVALIGGAQLQARQQEMNAQMRARMGGAGRLPF